MAKHKHRRRRSNPRRRRRSNPHRAHRRRHSFLLAPRHHRRRRNPSLRGMMGGSTVSLVGGGALGFFGARMIPQNLPFLSQYNTGITGYALNAGSGLAVSWLLKRFWNQQAATGALVGTGIAVISRILVEKFNKAGDSGMSGDLDFDLGYYTSDRFPFAQGNGGPYDAYPGTPYLPPAQITSAAAVRAGQAAAAAALPPASLPGGAADPTAATAGSRWSTGRWA